MAKSKSKRSASASPTPPSSSSSSSQKSGNASIIDEIIADLVTNPALQVLLGVGIVALAFVLLESYQIRTIAIRNFGTVIHEVRWSFLQQYGVSLTKKHVMSERNFGSSKLNF